MGEWSGAIRRNLAAVVLLSLITSLGFSAVNLLLPYYLMALQGLLEELPDTLPLIPTAYRAAVEIGGLVTAFMAARAAVAYASGWLSDRLGRRPMILGGAALYAATSLLYPQASSVPELFALRSLQGVASAMTWPVAEALLVDSVPPAVRTRALSLYVVSFTVGNAGGPLLGGAAYRLARMLTHGGPAEVFSASLLLVALLSLAGVAAAAAVREPAPAGQRRAGRPGQGGGAALPRWVRRGLLGFYINALLNGAAVGMVSSVMLVYLMERIVADPARVGLALAVPGLAGLLVSYPAARAMDRVGVEARRVVLAASIAANRVFMMLLGFTRSLPAFIAAASAMYMAVNIAIPLMRSLEASMVPSSLRGRVFGTHQAAFNLGMTLGPLLGSLIYEKLHDTILAPGITGVELTFIASGALGLTGVPILLRLYKPETAEEQAREANIAQR